MKSVIKSTLVVILIGTLFFGAIHELCKMSSDAKKDYNNGTCVVCQSNGITRKYKITGEHFDRDAGQYVVSFECTRCHHTGWVYEDDMN